MEVVNTEGRYEQREALPGSSADSDASSSLFDNDSSEQCSEDIDQTDEDDDLREDLQKNIPECYKSDSNFTSHTSDITPDEDFQTTALCQFMDILNDLDDVLDKSLLACLDDSAKTLDSDEEDLICKIKECIGDSDHSEASIDDNTQVICAQHSAPHIDVTVPDRPHATLGRSKSFSDLSESQRQTVSLERASTTQDNLRNSMRRLDPIVLPALSTEEPLTLPVILFLEHHVNLRPTSAPIQLQVTAANLSSDGASGPLIVGRRALLMNRTLSLPSPVDSELTGDWTGRNTARSTARSSSSSSSNESLAGVIPTNQTTTGATEERNEETDEPPFGVWPQSMSSTLACLGCTLGIFNISRFAVFSAHFGATFILQFFILSFLIGIPLFTLHICLGKVLQAGPMDMWRISPIFRGVGVALLIVQAVIGMYSVVGLSWILVYFRDSFTTTNGTYKWTLPHKYFYENENKNGSIRFEDTFPQYFHSEVLQRNLDSNTTYFGTIKFQVAFNLAVVWMIVFVTLSRGLKSYGNAVFIIVFLPICATIVLCIKIFTMIPYSNFSMTTETEWSEFFINSNSWSAATQEMFLTWGLFGACIIQISSHKNVIWKTNFLMQRDSLCVVSLTLTMLLLASFVANICVQILKNYGYNYISGSYESVKSSQFLWSTMEPLPGNQVSTPIRYMGHSASLVGVTVFKNGNNRALSGWQPLQLVTQLVPAALATLPDDSFSPVWVVMFYFIVIMFGLAQQLAIWHCVVCGLVAVRADALRVWGTTITFLSCLLGLAVGLALCTDAGIRIIHFIDTVWVGAWWQSAIYVSMIVGVFVVRGRPYSPDVVVAAMYNARTRLSATIAALLSFTWTVVLPVLLSAICVMDFRFGHHKHFYSWKKSAGYFPVWARQVAVFMQQGTVMVIPIAAFIQTWRYMSNGPDDIFERIQNLYRPRIGGGSETLPPRAPAAAPEPARAAPAPDPPPKYTPPPSYSTATGARLLNTIRRSFRTLRRITTSRTELQADDTSHTPITLSETVDREQQISLESHPPEYSGVFSAPSITITDETDSRTRPTSSTSRNSLSLTREYLRRSFVRKSDSVKSIRSSLRRNFKYGGALTTSHEHLVRDAEPISNTVAMSAMLDGEGSPPARSRASVI